jgi:hypothetical protein
MEGGAQCDAGLAGARPSIGCLLRMILKSARSFASIILSNEKFSVAYRKPFAAQCAASSGLEMNSRIADANA